jgi:hypothetical protein
VYQTQGGTSAVVSVEMSVQPLNIALSEVCKLPANDFCIQLVAQNFAIVYIIYCKSIFAPAFYEF